MLTSGESGGSLLTNGVSDYQSRAYAWISGDVTIVGGYMVLGYDAIEANDSFATLSVSGNVTVGGTAELDFTVDGGRNHICDQLTIGGACSINQAQGDRATLVIVTWIQSPPSNNTYTLLSSAGILSGNFVSVKNYGYAATWILPNPQGIFYVYTVKEQ
jgi:hypothetical protein